VDRYLTSAFRLQQKIPSTKTSAFGTSASMPISQNACEKEKVNDLHRSSPSSDWCVVIKKRQIITFWFEFALLFRLSFKKLINK
jgi:hypothetical protein